jgi:WD40 repeat protein
MPRPTRSLIPLVPTLRVGTPVFGRSASLQIPNDAERRKRDVPTRSVGTRVAGVDRAMGRVLVVAGVLGLLGMGAAAARGAEGPRVWAVIVGIDGYDDGAIPRCPGARTDARVVFDLIARDAGWELDQVLVLESGGQKQHGAVNQRQPTLAATRANLDWALKEWLPANAKRDDVVLVYFAGQAIGLEPMAEAPVRDYLLPSDAKAGRWDESGWSLERAIDGLASKGENPIVLWLDTSLMGRGRPVAGAPKTPPSGARWLDAMARWPNVTAWLAADGRPAAEGKGRNPGLFVAALRAGMGTKGKPANLIACLDRINRDPALAAQGFRTLGAAPPELSLWKGELAKLAVPEVEILLQQGHAREVVNVAVTPDADRLITGAMDATVKVWRASDRTLLRALPFHTIGVTGLSLSPDGRRLVSADLAGTLYLWDLADFRATRYVGRQRPHEAGVEQVEFLPDGAHFASRDNKGRVLLWTAGRDRIDFRTLADEGATAMAVGEGRVAVAGDEGGKPWLRLFGLDGKVQETLPAPARKIAAKCLRFAGDRLAYADKGRGLVVRDLRRKQNILEKTIRADALALSPGWLAVGSGRAISLFRLDATEPPRVLEVGERAEQVAFSAEGRWLAAWTEQTGRLHVWSLEGLKEVGLAGLKGVQARSAAFEPGGRGIVVGDVDGTVRSWSLPEGAARPEIPRHRGQVVALDVSRDGRYLLQITFDGKALVWDLREGRGLQVIRGQWTAGAFLPGGDEVALAGTERPKDKDPDGGQVSKKNLVAIADRASGWRIKTRLAPPPAAGGEALTGWDFDRVAASPDRRLVAAASTHGPLACVWDAATGELRHTLRIPNTLAGITSVGFSGDSRFLVTASDAPDGTVRVWDLKLAEPGRRPERSFHKDDVAITAARFHPKDPGRLATAHRDGRVLLWGPGRKEPMVLKPPGLSALHALAFTPDGKRLAAAGQDKEVWVWNLERPADPPKRPFPPHHEQVHALAAWPDGKLIASGGDDGEIKLWDSKGERLLGTLVANEETGEWVAYTPDGQFDSAPGAERRVTRLEGRSVLPLDQLQDRLHVFRLGDKLRRGETPELRAFDDGARRPNLAIDRPPAATFAREVELTIALGEEQLKDLRLYQNGIPVWEDDAAEAGVPARARRVRVALKKGLNRFYAMAARDDARGPVVGRSQDVEVRFDGPASPGKLHVLALGVSAYDRQKSQLRYAADDADAIVRFLKDRGVDAGDKACRLVALTDGEVTEERVKKELAQIRLLAAPEDTVVLFLAGHTEVFRVREAREEAFCLLLKDYPFPELKDAPAAAESPLVALRGSGARDELPVLKDRAQVLPFSTVVRYLLRFPAERRLVVIDACRAGAVLDDPAVRRRIERAAAKVDDEAHRARTAYILAARKDESAVEVESLKHGLLTYILLWGMGGAQSLQPPPTPVPPDADADGDKFVTTEELRLFADATLPAMAARFALAARRAGDNSPPIDPDAPPRIQATQTEPFPLVDLRRPAPAAGNR